MLEVIKAHPWPEHNYKDAWPVQSLIQTALANIKTQDRRAGTFFLLSDSARDSRGLDTGRINDQNVDPAESDDDGLDVNESAVSTRPHEEDDGSGGEERDDDDMRTDPRGQTPLPKPRARRSNREALQDGLGDSSDEGRQDARAVTQSARSKNRTITS